ncbi:uncharacterized protein LOC106142086 isoform X2 [Amyelois transitella]|nr:uncharacterized protein LOC106142086 isoform X2 [Amyelois transitella]
MLRVGACPSLTKQFQCDKLAKRSRKAGPAITVSAERFARQEQVAQLNNRLNDSVLDWLGLETSPTHTDLTQEIPSITLDLVPTTQAPSVLRSDLSIDEGDTANIGNKMEDDNSDDVIMTSSCSEIDQMIEVPDDKPLMHLFKRLIGDNKQSTMLTNTQIINILQKELDLDVAFLHDLEVEVYLNLMKKFLKDWAQWDMFDLSINKLKEQRNYDSIRTLLQETHLKLKSYLKEILNKATPIMKEMIGNSIEKNKNEEGKGESTVFMEIYCTRDQLNGAILRRPTANNSIFKIIDDPVLKNNLSHKCILNWWDVQVKINVNGFLYQRETVHELKHTLVNKKLNKDENCVVKLNEKWQSRPKKGILKTSIVETDISDILNMINKIVQHYSKYDKYRNIVEAVFEQISLDLNGAPEIINLFTDYRRYMSKYSYVRYLFSENSEDLPLEGNLYDLQLKEVVSPRFVFQAGKLEFPEEEFPDNLDWITIKCGLCKEKKECFSGDDLDSAMVSHFSNCHSNEPDFQCVLCKNSFTMAELAENRWEHSC